MALIRSFTRSNGSARPHPSEVDCQWQPLSDASGQRLLQLSTFGSDMRRSQPKVSQTIQIDAATAKQLLQALRETFPELND
jgi:hypothetical protein